MESIQRKSLESEFGSPPFGWDVDVVKLFSLALLRSGQITVTSQGTTIDSVNDLAAVEAFTNNSKFRACTFRPKRFSILKKLVKAAAAFEQTFGERIASLTQDEVAKAIKRKATALSVTCETSSQYLNAVHFRP